MCVLRVRNLTNRVRMPYNVCMSHTSLKPLLRSNRRIAKRLWGNQLDKRQFRLLGDLTRRFGLSVAEGDLQLLNRNWYITHAGLLRIAHKNRCSSVTVQPVREYCDSKTNHWVFKATVYRSNRFKGFVGYGDADPSNVSPLVRGAEMRVAETRAVNRALRKAYGIGLCSVEELGWQSSGSPAPNDHNYWTNNSDANRNSNGANNGQRLRDQLCILIRKHNLDPNLVRQYAADYCGTAALKDASRELVASFISHLAESAKQNRDALICKLNSYAQSVGTKS